MIIFYSDQFYRVTILKRTKGQKKAKDQKGKGMHGLGCPEGGILTATAGAGWKSKSVRGVREAVHTKEESPFLYASSISAPLKGTFRCNYTSDNSIKYV